MTSDGAVRFWRPTDETSTEFLCAHLETGHAAAHVHEEWQFAVAEVAAGISVGAFRRYATSPDDVTVIAPHEVHSEREGKNGTPRWRVLYVAAPVVGRLYQEARGRPVRPAPRFHGPVLTDRPAGAELRALLLDSERGGAEFDFVAGALDWLRRLLERHASDIEPATRLPAVERARRFIRERPTEPARLSDVVAVAGVSVSHLVRSFSRVVGLPPRSYHAQIRLARARRLLAEGRSATWVAYECGFADQSHLSRRFRECYGITPGAFQAQHRGRPDPHGGDARFDAGSNAA